MNVAVRDPLPNEKRGNVMAAALAKEQLTYAVQVVKEVMPHKADDSVLIAAVLQAMAANYAGAPQPNR
jgi:hypothetical protein